MKDLCIAILTMARSRSSLTAHLLHRHGVWADRGRRADQWNRSGYYENYETKILIKGSRTNIYKSEKHCVPSEPIPGFTDQLMEVNRKRGYKRGPWLSKVDAMAYPIYAEFDPLYVCVFRDPEGILDSIQRTPFMRSQGYSDQHWRMVIRRHHEVMDEVLEQGGMRLDTDQLVEGDHVELMDIVKRIGLTYDRNHLEAALALPC